MRTISNTDDVIDSRDVIERIEELTTECADWISGETDGERTRDLWAAEFPDESTELVALEALQADAEGYSGDWKYGAQLVRDSYFKDHAQELAEDCGMIPSGLSWPCTCIDWDQAARELQMDYTSVEFAGVTYWVR